jgi:lipid II:glycine glycyltransferase (peptidoglycan interpeptide bridge formation enzyme)
LSDISNEKKLWSGLRENIRTDIKKAQGRFGVKVQTNYHIDDFLRLNALTYARQNMKAPDSPDIIRRLDDACNQHQARRIFIAEDAEGKHHAGVFLVWDKCSAYYLMGGSDPVLRNSGAISLCLWEAIKFASTVTKSFDFEGSMIEPIERFFRAFGAEQTPFFTISNTPSKLLRTYYSMRELFR